MKNKVFLLPLSTLLLCSGNQSDIRLPNDDFMFADTFDFVCVGASLDGYPIDISFAASFSSLNQNRLIEVHKLNPITIKYALIEIVEANQRIVYKTFTFNENYTLSDYQKIGLDGPRFKFLIKDGKNELVSKIFDTKSINYEDIVHYDVGDSSLIRSEKNIFYYDGKRDYKSFLNEVFTFSEYVKAKEYDFNYQNSIDISSSLLESKLNYRQRNVRLDFESRNCYITMNDVNNYFPYLHVSNEDPTVVVFGEIYNLKSGVGFRINDNLFIDPTTRITYREKKRGLVRTNMLYFPLGVKRASNAEGNKFTLTLGKCGFSKSALHIDFNIGNFSNTLIGDCATSSFCVTSYPSNPDFSFNEEVIVND